MTTELPFRFYRELVPSRILSANRIAIVEGVLVLNVAFKKTLLQYRR